MLPNVDAVHFCDIFSDIGQCCRPAQETVSIIKNPATLGSTGIIDVIFSNAEIWPQTFFSRTFF